MLGAIAGDIAGSIYEHNNVRTKDIELFVGPCTFTDDTVLTIALMECLLEQGNYAEYMKRYALAYPKAGYGTQFWQWVKSEINMPYNSFGNGSAMRVSPVGFIYNELPQVLKEAKKSAAITHNHPEGIKGAQAVAAVVFLARTGHSKSKIKEFITSTFGYDLSRNIDDIRYDYTFDSSCQGSVPQAIVAFLEAESFEDALLNAISIGGDSDTIASMAGAMAEAFYGVPEWVQRIVLGKLDERLTAVVKQYY